MSNEGRAALALVKELVLRLKDEGVLDGRDIFDIYGLWSDVVREE